MKKLMLCAAGAAALFIAGCGGGGAPSPEEFKAALMEQRKTVPEDQWWEKGISDEAIAVALEIYTKLGEEDRQKAFDSINKGK